MTPLPPLPDPPEPAQPTYCLLDHQHGPDCDLSFHTATIRQEALWRASYSAQRRAAERLWHQRITTACIVTVTLLASILLIRLITEIPT